MDLRTSHFHKQELEGSRHLLYIQVSYILGMDLQGSLVDKRILPDVFEPRILLQSRIVHKCMGFGIPFVCMLG